MENGSETKSISAATIIKSDTCSARNYGIDALRFLSMFLVVILHILGNGGVLNNTVGAKRDVVMLLEVFAYCSVDIYAIISGYVGYTEEHRPFRSAKYLSMWLQVFCYSFGITLIAFLVAHQSVSRKALILSFFPVLSGQYWYFTAFTVVFLLKPWINRFIRALTKKELTAFAFVIFGLFSICVTIANPICGDPLKLMNGYSAVWLILLYIIGAWLKKCSIADVIRSRSALLILTVFTLITWAAKQYIPGAGFLVSYVSPTVLIPAIAFVIIFSKIRVSGKLQKLIAAFAPAVFGVYLIHVQPIIFDRVFRDAFLWITYHSAWLIPILVIGSAAAVFTVCILIEKLRLFLFRLLKIDALTDVVGNKADRLSAKIRKKTDLFFEGR